MKRIAILVLASAMLSACGGEAEAPRDGDGDANRTAEGEVLGGAVTDDMIPLDQLRSQSPAMEPVTTTTSTSTETETDEGTSTNVERSVSVTSGGPAAAAPEPPQVPTPPRQQPAADQ
ncbi:MAG: hypothetical protein ABJ239_01715 [Erythrobacter sp.]